MSPFPKPITVPAGSEHPRLLSDFEAHPDTAAVKELYGAAVDTARAIYLEPGDLLLLNNHEAIHGRTLFGYDRTGWTASGRRYGGTVQLPTPAVDEELQLELQLELQHGGAKSANLLASVLVSGVGRQGIEP